MKQFCAPALEEKLMEEQADVGQFEGKLLEKQNRIDDLEGILQKTVAQRNLFNCRGLCSVPFRFGCVLRPLPVYFDFLAFDSRFRISRTSSKKLRVFTRTCPSS